MNLAGMCAASLFIATLLPAALVSYVEQTADQPSSLAPIADEDGSFCFVSTEWAAPSKTIHASDRREAERRAGAGRVFCKEGPCTFEGQMEPLQEGCIPDSLPEPLPLRASMDEETPVRRGLPPGGKYAVPIDLQ